MVFSSPVFLFPFLPVVLLAHLAAGGRARNEGRLVIRPGLHGREFVFHRIELRATD